MDIYPLDPDASYVIQGMGHSGVLLAYDAIAGVHRGGWRCCVEVPRSLIHALPAREAWSVPRATEALMAYSQKLMKSPAGRALADTITRVQNEGIITGGVVTARMAAEGSMQLLWRWVNGGKVSVILHDTQVALGLLPEPDAATLAAATPATPVAAIGTGSGIRIEDPASASPVRGEAEGTAAAAAEAAADAVSSNGIIRGDGADVDDEATRGGASGSGGGNAPCVLCLDADRRIALLPCGHLCLCAGCAERVVEPDGGGRCPVCRGAVTAAQVVYV
eukprot:TRINITY_DN2374_c0_g1_i3.p2 TRINITY_DN2374_c0_g1~~TRINITY_DN2374_c0_g1_i3.p2  ORF type:complete len:277 (+),score=62.06 TRINITY_DN2374_c0_g1_i3:1350-2180(+)